MTEQPGEVDVQPVGNEGARMLAPTMTDQMEAVPSESEREDTPERQRLRRHSPEELARQAEMEAHWRGVMEDWRKSGLDGRNYCRVKGLGEHNFYAWKRVLRLRDAELSPRKDAKHDVPPSASRKSSKAKPSLKKKPPARPLFLPVHVKAPGFIEIRHSSGHTLIVHEGCSDTMLRSVLEAFERR